MPLHDHEPNLRGRGFLWGGIALGILLCLAPYSFAQQASTDATPSVDAAHERFAVHGQLTFVEQLALPFHDPYAGQNSLSPRHGDETFDVTLYLGARLWSGAELWANPEIDQGFGLNNTLGVAGFPSGEAYKVGRSYPYWRVPRLFVRQTVDLDGESEPVEAIANQLGGSQSANRWVFTFGKISVPDIFDANQYAHDPRNDFLNWAAVDAGTFDYAADSWGYTVGAAAEWYQGEWTLRAGVFDLSGVPNSETLDHGFHEFQWIGELEKRHELMGKPGKLLVTAFDSRARIAVLDQAVNLAAATGESIDTALVVSRRYRSRAGVSFDLEQQLGSDLGMFARAGKGSGNLEAYEFSDIDRSVSIGLSIKGGRWGRADDTLALAAIDNCISANRERFLNAGGLGILVGDGQLPHPGAEQILETYYRWAAVQWAELTLDYQYVLNPAYNTDRGPVSIVALRLHAHF
jgi:high affinity Mn2+ porin